MALSYGGYGVVTVTVHLSIFVVVGDVSMRVSVVDFVPPWLN
jgi:hypothetical protein